MKSAREVRKEYNRRQYQSCPHVKAMLYGALDVVMRGFAPGRWLVFPGPSDQGKDTVLDDMADKVIGERPCPQMNSRWVNDEEKLRAEGLGVSTIIITKITEMSGLIQNSLWKKHRSKVLQTNVSRGAQDRSMF